MRDIKKAILEYKRRFEDTNEGGFYLSDYCQIRDMSETGSIYGTLLAAIDNALQAGFMIGYRKGLNDARKKGDRKK